MSLNSVVPEPASVPVMCLPFLLYSRSSIRHGDAIRNTTFKALAYSLTTENVRPHLACIGTCLGHRGVNYSRIYRTSRNNDGRLTACTRIRGYRWRHSILIPPTLSSPPARSAGKHYSMARAASCIGFSVARAWTASNNTNGMATRCQRLRTDWQ